MPFELRELHQGDGCNALSLGDPGLTPLKTFLIAALTLSPHVREIAARRIDLEYIDAVEKAERERKEREALEWAAAEVVADDDLSKGDD